MDMTVERMQAFFKRYDTFRSIHIDEQLSGVKKLFSNYKAIQHELNEYNKLETPYFNVFNTLSLQHAEERLHTPLIASFLNPSGDHGQGDLFYKIFIDKFFSDTVFNQYDPRRLYVKAEYWVGTGEVDIFIQHRSMYNPYAIVIENKIYAADQDKQLLRYRAYLDELTSIPSGSKYIFYLKPFGGDPSECSVDQATLFQWIQHGTFRSISYKEHIIEWLELSLKEIRSPKLKFIIEQYLEILNTICHE